MEDGEVVTTFTGEKLCYNPQTHKYTTLEGEKLLSGSTYADWFAEPFDRDKWLKRTAKKLKVTTEQVAAAWDLRGDMSRTFGTSLHKAMECWFKYRDLGYGIPKHPFLKEVVNSFPLKSEKILSELMVSDLKRGLVGQIDGLNLTNPKVARIIDYKSDASVGSSLFKHFNQLSFYAHILMAHGWVIDELQVWNYTDKWTEYKSPVLELRLDKRPKESK